jgi:hypothetical protein
VKQEILNGDGRWLIQVPKGYEGKVVINGRYLYRYRYRMEQKLGRLLSSNEFVHHINGDKTDDRLENLQLTNQQEHAILHSKGRAFVVLICSYCGKEILREKRNIKNLKNFCDGVCSIKYYKPSKKLYAEIKHGTYAGYKKKCKCTECMEANRLYSIKLRINSLIGEAKPS